MRGSLLLSVCRLFLIIISSTYSWTVIIINVPLYSHAFDVLKWREKSVDFVWIVGYIWIGYTHIITIFWLSEIFREKSNINWVCMSICNHCWKMSAHFQKKINTNTKTNILRATCMLYIHTMFIHCVKIWCDRTSCNAIKYDEPNGIFFHGKRKKNQLPNTFIRIVALRCILREEHNMKKSFFCLSLHYLFILSQAR